MLLSLVAMPAIAQTPLGTSFSYQGRLDLSGSPVTGSVDFRFSLWDALTAGNLVASSPQVNGVTVTDGLFTVAVDFGAGAFNGTARWIEIEVASPSGGAFETLTPRQPLTAAPLAQGLPAIRNIDRNEGFAIGSWNIVGGARFNTVDPLAAGVTISGGGRQFGANVAYDNFSVIGGGDGHLTGTDNGDPDDAAFATIGGGSFNIASGNYSTVAGGVGNQATGFLSFIGGGEENVASGDDAAVPGGQLNSAAGAFSFAAGRRAKANHDGSFVWGDSTNANFFSTGNNQFLLRAAGGVGIGTNAPASALSIAGDIDISGSRLHVDPSNGRIGIGTTTPTRPLTIKGSGANSDWLQFRTSSNADVWHLTNEGGGLNFVETNVSPNRLFLAPGGNVGIGTTNPQARLDVNGDVVASGQVGIGRTSPSAALDVVGDIKATGTISGQNLSFEGNIALDQAQETETGGVNTNFFWQAFVPGVSGRLARIEFSKLPNNLHVVTACDIYHG
ncbi:MAG: hypothetical protein KDA63_12080, partial [Planctomycetales bacterium]|nr:hypothetical protein [Planctomycetales bacterium]